MDMTGIVIAVVSLLITVIVIGGVFFTLYKVFGGMKKANQERERLLREGIQATARITNVQMGGMTMTVGVHRHLQLRIGLEVQPQGRAPYQALLTTMVSELQIPQLQPGVTLTVRYDANDPMKLALEGVGAAAAVPSPQGYGGPAHGALAAPGYGAAGAPAGYAAPHVVPGMPQAAPGGMQPGGMVPGGMVPVAGTPGMPAGAKIGLVIGILGALVGIGAAVVVVVVNVLDVGGGAVADATSGDGVCAQAARCCETIGGPAEACKNYGRVAVPETACRQALEGYRTAASSQGKSCE